MTRIRNEVIVTSADEVPKCGKNWKFAPSMNRNRAEQPRRSNRLLHIDECFAGMEVRA